MNKKLIILFIIILLTSISLCGCFQDNENIININSEEERFLGKWSNSSIIQGRPLTITYHFFSNKTYEVTAITEIDEGSYYGTWEAKDSKLFIAIEGRTQIGNYQFIDNDNKLIISDINNGNSSILIKQ
jgi:hypothetical protein